MQVFPGTEIERKVHGKSELAKKLGISPNTLRRYIRRIDHKFDKYEDYSKYSKILFPQHIEVILKHYGWL